MVIDPIVFVLVVSALVLCALVLLGLLGRHLWLRKVDAAAMETILTSLDAMANTRHQVIANALRRFYEQDETALNEQAGALVGYELAMQRNVLEAFATRRLSGLAALPGWAEQMVSPYHAIIQRLSDGSARARQADDDSHRSEQIDALRMAIHSDIACLKDDIHDETKQLHERLAASDVRLTALEAAIERGPGAETGSVSSSTDTGNAETTPTSAGIVFDNDDQAIEKPPGTAADSVNGAATPSDAGTEQAMSTPEDDDTTGGAAEPMGTDDLLVVDEAGDEDQDDLAAAWAEALEEAGTDDVDIDAMLENPAPDARQSA